MSNLDTFYNKKRNFPDAEEREFDDLSPIPATLYRVGALVNGIGGVSTIKGRHGIRLTCRLLPPKEGDVGEVRAILSKTRRELGRFRLEPGCQLICCGRCYKVLDFRFNSYPKYAILLLAA